VILYYERDDIFLVSLNAAGAREEETSGGVSAMRIIFRAYRVINFCLGESQNRATFYLWAPKSSGADVCAGIFFIPDLPGDFFNKSYDYFDLGVLRTQLHWIMELGKIYDN
jgi:hypothetical protein